VISGGLTSMTAALSYANLLFYLHGSICEGTPPTKSSKNTETESRSEKLSPFSSVYKGTKPRRVFCIIFSLCDSIDRSNTNFKNYSISIYSVQH
jgi:hypothetical protein